MEYTHSYDYKVITDDEAFQSLETAWNELFADSVYDNIELNFFWLFTVWKHYQNYDRSARLHIVCIYEKQGAALVAILPLMKTKIRYKRIFKIDQLSFLGDAFCDYSGFVIRKNREKAVLAFLCQVVLFKSTVKWHVLLFKNLSENNPLLNHLIEALRESGLPFKMKEKTKNYYINTRQPFDAYYKNLSSGFRQNLRTANNRLKRFIEEHDTFVALGELNSLDPKGFERLIALNLKRQQSKGRGTIFKHPAYYNFVKDLLIENARFVSILSIKIGDEVIASSINLIFKDTYMYWSPSLDEKYLDLSPGHLLLEKIVQKCFEEKKIACIDFAIGDSEYKARWASGYHSSNLLRIMNPEKRFTRLLEKL